MRNIKVNVNYNHSSGSQETKKCTTVVFEVHNADV